MLRSLTLAALVAITSVALARAPATACVSAPAPFDSFTEIAPSAGTIVVGTADALSSRQPTSRFRFETDEVIRGGAPAFMRFGWLRGGTGRSACGDQNAVVHVREGDRLALAMTAPKPGVPQQIRAVAFVGDSAPARRFMRRVEQLPLTKVRRLAGRPADGSASRQPYRAGIAADNLITERVAPGVARVSRWGARHDIDAVRHLDVSDRGWVWATTWHAAFQLAKHQEYGTADDVPRFIGTIVAGPAGSAFAQGRGIAAFEARGGWGQGEWERIEGGAANWWPFMAQDGTTLALSSRGLSRLDEDGWTRFDWTEVGVPEACVDAFHPLDQSHCAGTRLAEAPDGSIWLGFHANTGWGGGLRRFDGRTWTDVPDPMDGEKYAVTHLASKAGGPVWALIVPRNAGQPGTGAYDRAQLARWDGAEWTRFGIPAELRTGQRGQPRELVAGPHGVVWLSRPLASFDGSTWRRYQTPARPTTKNPRVQDLSIAPDGAAWMVVADQIKFRTTRPDGIYVLDTRRAQPMTETAAETAAVAN